jgi:hypothetical protein
MVQIPENFEETFRIDGIKRSGLEQPFLFSCRKVTVNVEYTNIFI